MNRRPWLAGMAGAAMLSGASITAALAAMASPSAVALRTADLPIGYKLAIATTVTNVQMAKNTKVPKAQFDKHGRITGFEEQFRTTNMKMPTNIFVNVYAYKTPAGAAWDYSQSTAHDLKAMHKVGAPKVGAASVAMTERIAGSGQKIDIFVVDFHRGNYDVTIGAGGVTGHVHLGDAVKYARIVDRRIQSSK